MFRVAILVASNNSKYYYGGIVCDWVGGYYSVDRVFRDPIEITSVSCCVIDIGFV